LLSSLCPYSSSFFPVLCLSFLLLFPYSHAATTDIYTLSLHDALPIFFCFVNGAHSLCLDRDAALSLQIHIVKNLRLHLSLRQKRSEERRVGKECRARRETKQEKNKNTRGDVDDRKNIIV